MVRAEEESASRLVECVCAEKRRWKKTMHWGKDWKCSLNEIRKVFRRFSTFFIHEDATRRDKTRRKMETNFMEICQEKYLTHYYGKVSSSQQKYPFFERESSKTIKPTSGCGVRFLSQVLSTQTMLSTFDCNFNFSQTH